MNRTVLVKRYATVEIPGGTEQAKARLSVITFVGAVDIRLCEDKNLRAKVVPLDLGLLSLEKCLLTGRWSVEVKQSVDANARRLALLFGDKDSDGGVEAGTERDTGCTLNLEPVNDTLPPLRRIENLNLCTNKTNGVGFRDCVLNIPSVIVLLRKGNELLASGDRKDAQVLVLSSVSKVDMTLPCGKICPARRKP